MAKRHTPKISPDIEAELRDRLEELLDQRDDAAAKRKRLSQLLGWHLRVIDQTVALTRRQLKGMDLDQLELPGTQVPEPKNDPIVLEILRVAGAIPPPAPAAAPEKPAAAKDEPPKISWRKGSTFMGLAAFTGTVTGGGTYLLEETEAGAWTATWTPATGKPKKLVYNTDEGKARVACEKHHLEAHADALLKNAGDGSLTKADTKGDAIARKKGGRRG